ncbi:zinc ribbon domain-containing protein [Candidatus Lokiarchaeum ossiferum]|uniref:zinc ribbon domain-containing protein n=1 Tax=Candidatus Lokiarchaeum ossiferum TaxID=2951803 RepID=UPI00352EA8CC
MEKHYHHHKKHDEMPHSEFLGSLIAFFVVVIAMNGIFPHDPWFAVLPQVILAFIMIKNGVLYIQSRDARRNFVYTTTQDDLWHIWLAAIIVNIVMSAIFHGSWIGRIPTTVLNIKAIEITITYIAAQKQRKNATLYTQRYVSPVAQPVATVHNTTSGAYVTLSTPSDVAQFCPICGEKHEADYKFCASCGASLY